MIGGTKFYERAEIKDAVAYLSLLVNPSDQVSFGRVVNSPRRGIGNTTQGRLAAHANTTGLPIWEVVGRVEEVPGLGAAAIKVALPLPRDDREPDRTGRARRAGRRDPAGDAQRERLPGSARGRAHDRGRGTDREPRGADRRSPPSSTSTTSCEGESEVPPLEEFLQQISLYTEQDGLRADESLVTLMTLHNAKGLEYDTVFIVGCEEGAFPHMRALEEGGEEEERRLCYVGITRARQRLYMTWARERRLFGRAERNLPSRFVDELPAELTERHGGSTGGAGGWEAAAAAGAAQPIDPGPTLELRTGDDVVHASFGDGVVTARRAGRGGRRPLRRRRHRAQADGRLRPDPEAVGRVPGGPA